MSMVSRRGFTLLEILIALGIFGLIVLSISWILVNSLRSNDIVWSQLSTQTDGRKVLQQVVDEVRRAEQSSIGSYPIELAEAYEFIFYANVDNDSERERVRFGLDNGTIKRGIVSPSGSPLQYNPADEQVVEIAHNVRNVEQENPLFSYFGEGYSGTQAPLAEPVLITAVRVVRVQLELEEDPTATPVPLHVESTVSIRNLKQN
jgi:prepilin-type N-terminal cleavage/methylation domain-containing protein